MKKGKVLGKLGCVFLFLALLLALMPTTALAAEQPPMVLDGYVTINGVPAVDGTPVEARVDGAVVASSATFTNGGGAGAYVLGITNAYDGEDIYVFVYGIEGTDSPIDWPLAWYSGLRHKDVSITKAHLVTAIAGPVGTETYSTEQQFTVTATVANTGQEDATDVTATLSIDVGATLVVGTATQNIGALAVGVISADITWTLVCNSSDAVTITVTPAGQTPDNTDAAGFVPIPEANLEADSVTVNQELKAHLAVTDVSSDLTDDTASTLQDFTISATVSNDGEAVAEDVTAALTITGGTGTATITGGPDPVSVATLAGGATQGFTWEVQCTGSGTVEFLVTPSGIDENTGEAVLEANIETGSITIGQELKAHLVATITAPVGTETYSTEQEFTVTVTVANTGEADVDGVIGTIDIDGPAELQAGETSEKVVEADVNGHLDGVGGWEACTTGSLSWTLVCTGSGEVTITVTPNGTDENTGEAVLEANIEADSVTVDQEELKATLVASISSPVEGDTYSIEQEFTVTATVANTGEADALAVTATIGVTGGAELAVGETAAQTIGAIAGGATSSSVSWTLVCNSTDAVTITVTPAGTDENTGEAVLEADIEADSVTVNVIVYTLTMAVTGNGTTTPEVGDHTYSADEVVNITASADAGWEFVSWTGDVADSDSAATTVTMDSNKAVTANFSLIVYTLTMAVAGNGTTTPEVGDHTYPPDQVVNITASADAGWEFVSWTGDVADSDSAATTVTVDSNKAVTANFSLIGAITYNIALGLGWNYISLPLIPEDSDIEAVLESVEGKYEDIWAYDAATETWRTYKPGAPPEYYDALAADGTEQLETMVDGLGYMINMTEAGSLVGTGLEQRVGPYMPPTYSVYQGWNLVGFKTMDFNDDDLITQADDSMAVGYYLLTMDKDVDDQVVGDEVTYLRYYQPADGQFHELSDADIMLVGYGYWLYARVSGEIVPPIESEG